MERKQELEMMFDAIDEDGKRFVLAVLRGEFKRTQKLSRPRLRLVSKASSDLVNHQVNPLSVSGAG
jgi:hypothetical protein